MRALWICQPRRDELLWSLQDRWAQGQAGRGPIVVLSGEAGIGKSRLVRVVQDELIGAATLGIEYRLLVEQEPTARLLTLLTCRPEFQPPWGLRTHLTPIALQRLPQLQVEAMIARVTGGAAPLRLLCPSSLSHCRPVIFSGRTH